MPVGKAADPTLPLFPESRNKAKRAAFSKTEAGSFVEMGGVHQLASASLAAAFSILLLVTTHLFIGYQSAKNPAIAVVHPIPGPI